LWNFLSGLEIVNSIARPLKIYCDNSIAAFFSKVVKHMELKYVIVKEEVQKQIVSIKYISTNLMIVDHLTKGLLLKTFIEHVKSMNIIVVDDH